jgi:hypothetical protein
MNRRDFLLLRPDGAPHTAVLSCERLYMRYVDSQMSGSTALLFASLNDEIRNVAALRLTDTSWLACGDLKDRLDGMLERAGVAVTIV